jgi:hypothetical protein
MPVNTVIRLEAVGRSPCGRWRRVRFPDGRDKDFAKTVAFLADYPGARIPPAYGDRLRALRWRYRRQLNPGVFGQRRRRRRRPRVAHA